MSETPLEDDLPAVAGLIEPAFGMDPGNGLKWIERARQENLRVARDPSGAPVGSLALVPMGQWFGGRSVPTGGIAAVAVAPHARGTGVARRLMDDVLRELAEQGVALSTLFPASLHLYRRSGYEIAGSYFRVKLPLERLAVNDRSLPLRPMRPGDESAVHALYSRLARPRNGYLDRGEYVWGRIANPAKRPVRGFVVEEDGDVVGYCYLDQVGNARNHYDLWLNDVAALHAPAARRLLTLFADHRSLADHVGWYGGIDDPLLAQLPERGADVFLYDPWMIRIVDVAAALTARGWPAGIDAELHLSIEDELLEGNAGDVVLSVSDGVASVEPGGSGEVALHARGLAALYSGHSSPATLAAMGLMDAPEDARRRAAALFAGPAPAMVDAF